MYIAGIRDGLMTAEKTDLWPNGFAVDDFTKELNKLYSEGENVNIPMSWAFTYVNIKLRGQTSASELEKTLMTYRKQALIERSK